MTPNPLQKPADELDSLLSEFFKAQLKKPWPKAPVPTPATPAVPSELAAARAAEVPRNAPSTPALSHDSAGRARFTLAASVALLLGTGWFLADGFQPGPHSRTDAVPGAGHMFLPDSGADGHDHPPLKKMGEDKAKGNDGGAKDDMGIRLD